MVSVVKKMNEIVKLRQAEIESLKKLDQHIEELKSNANLSDSAYNEIRAKISSRMAQCEISIRDHSTKSKNKVMEEKTYTEQELVSFGKYLLSEERSNRINGDKSEVYDADLANWNDNKN